MSVYFPEPGYRDWFEVEVDGKYLGLLEVQPDDKAAIAEKNRLKDLKGIVLRTATNDRLAEVNAKTVLPRSVLRKMYQMHIKAVRRAEKEAV